MPGEKNRPEQCWFGELPVAAIESEEDMLPSRAVVSPSTGPSPCLWWWFSLRYSSLQTTAEESSDTAISSVGSDGGDLQLASC